MIHAVNFLSYYAQRDDDKNGLNEFPNLCIMDLLSPYFSISVSFVLLIVKFRKKDEFLRILINNNNNNNDIIIIVDDCFIPE